MAFVTYPLTGSGDTTVKIPVDLIVDEVYQYLKLTDGTPGSSLPIIAKQTTPGTTDAGMVTRNIPSTGLSQLVTVGNPSTAVDATLTSAGSTRLAGRVTVDNPTTAVTVSSGVVLGAGSSANTIGAIAQGAGSTLVAPWYVISSAGGGAGSTTVDANLTSVGSTRLVGRMDVNNPTTVVSLSTNPGLTSGSSEVALTSVGSTRLVGRVDVNNPTTSVTVTSGVVLAAGSSANIIGAVVIDNGTSGDLVGAAIISSGSWSSANVLGQVAQGPGSSANYWIVDSVPFSSGNVSRSSVATSVDVQIIAANANRKALVIAAGSTVQTVAIGLTTAVMTTALANLSCYLAPADVVTFGLQGQFPLYKGPVRAINITSTAVGGGVVVSEFT